MNALVCVLVSDHDAYLSKRGSSSDDSGTVQAQQHQWNVPSRNLQKQQPGIRAVKTLKQKFVQHLTSFG